MYRPEGEVLDRQVQGQEEGVDALKPGPVDNVIEQRLVKRSKVDVLDHIMTCREDLEKCTSIISSPYETERRVSYYKKKYQRVYNRCRVAGEVLAKKIGDNPTANTLVNVLTRFPGIFTDFVFTRYFKKAWEPVVKGMVEKGYLSKEDHYIIKALDMARKYAVYLSTGE
jgi:hypothetical protein